MMRTSLRVGVCGIGLVCATLAFGSVGSGGSGGAGSGAGDAVIDVPEYPPGKPLGLADIRELYQFGTITADGLCKAVKVLESQGKREVAQMVKTLIAEQHIQCK